MCEVALCVTSLWQMLNQFLSDETDVAMSNTPAFQFYPRQWLGDDKVMLMDFDARGLHVHYMCIAWQRDPPCTLPDDDDMLRKWASNPDDWERIKTQVLAAWKLRDGLWVQTGLEREYLKQKKLREKRTDAANKRWGNDGVKKADASALQVECPSSSTSTSSSSSTADSKKSDEFAAWWKRYPSGRKIDKQKCEKKFVRLSKKDREDAAGPAYQAWLDYWVSKDPEFIPGPHKWLHNRRWEAGPPAKKKGVSNHQDPFDDDLMAEEHKKSCENALKLVNVVAFEKDWPDDIASQLKTMGGVILAAAAKSPGDGYQEIVEAEDLLLDIVADEYELDAQSTTGRRRLAREKIGLPVLY